MPNSFSSFSLPFARSLPPFTPLSSSVALPPLRDFFGHCLSRHYHIGSLTYKRRADSWLLLHMAFRRCCSGLLFRCHLRVRHRAPQSTRETQNKSRSQGTDTKRNLSHKAGSEAAPTSYSSVRRSVDTISTPHSNSTVPEGSLSTPTVMPGTVHARLFVYSRMFSSLYLCAWSTYGTQRCVAGHHFVCSKHQQTVLLDDAQSQRSENA